MASFRKRGKQWEYRISYKDPFEKDYKIKSKGGFQSKKEAKAAAALAEIEIAEGFEVNQKPHSLEGFLESWLIEYKKGTVRKNTFLLHERNIKNHILPYFKNMNIQDVKPIMYQKFLNELANKGYSKRTIEIIHGTMFSAMKKAVTLQKMKHNPCEGSTIPKQKDQSNKTLKYIVPDQVPAFLQAAYQDNEVYYLYFKLLIETGMRKGEAAALQWTDIDFSAGEISINKSLDFQATSSEDLFGDTKTFNSTRTILVGSSLLQELREHLKAQNKNKVMLNEFYRHDYNLVFCRRDGHFLPKSTLFNAFARYLKKAGISPLPIHSLRHTHAVMLLESGASMKYIQKRLGHGSMTITADVYSHVSDQLNKETIDEFEKYSKRFLK